MKKCYYEQFKKLPPGYRERAELRMEQDTGAYYGQETHITHVSDALGSAFDWTRTPEGSVFWANVNRWAYKASELPYLPPL